MRTIFNSLILQTGFGFILLISCVPEAKAINIASIIYLLLGEARNTCDPSFLGTTNAGCVFYPTITNNFLLDPSVGAFEIAVTNPSKTKTANIQVTRGASLVTTQKVSPGSVSVIALPWVPELLNATTTLVVDGAYRLESDNQVIVYQYNPLDYTDGLGNFTYTNEASLLLPEQTWGDKYVVVARNHSNSVSAPGFFAVTANNDNTTVTVLSPSNIVAGSGIAANGTGTVVINKGDVLHVATSGGGVDPDPNDITGTLITTDKSIQVIGGHACANIPYDIGFCDHLEESMIPVSSLGLSYIVAAPLITSNTLKPRNVRIIATEDGTTLTYSPSQAGAPSALNASQYAEIAGTSDSFIITANKKVLVAQYMLGQLAGGDAGDPAMTLEVPISQYMNDYIIYAPVNYESNYMNIIVQTGTSVSVDGNVIGGFTNIGTTGYSVSRIQLSNNADGVHKISATNPVSVSIYGYGQFTSYWYPGGLSLKQL